MKIKIKGIKFSRSVKTIKLSEYFKLIKPKYIYLKITPDKSIRNYNSANIIKTMTKIYKNIFKRIERKNKHFSFHCEAKCSFFIDIRKNEVSFYLIAPDTYTNTFKEKIRETWGKARIEEAESIEQFSEGTSMCQLYYKKENPLSLEVDKKSNEPLNSILSVLDIMEDKDRIGVFYNFMPRSQVGWRQEYKNTIDKIQHKEPVDREVSLIYCLKMAGIVVTSLLDYVLSVFGDFIGKEEDNKNLSFLEAAVEIINTNLVKLSPSTSKKATATVINTQIVAFSQSDNYMRKLNSMLSLTGAFQSIAEDNELVSKSYKIKKNTTFDFNKFNIPGTITNTTSIEECSRFIQIPGKTLLQEFNNIEQIKTLETKVPKDLQQGTKLLGISEYRGTNVKAYLTTHRDYKNLAIVVIAPTRSGKTSLLGNFARDSIKANECVIYMDWIENCQAADKIKKCVDNVLELNLADYEHLEGLGYNEAITASTDPIEIYDSAKDQANQFTYFVNSVNTIKNSNNTDMSSKMDKYLSAACLIVFTQGGAFKDVFNVLQEHEIRRQYINTIPNNLKDRLNRYEKDLLELDEWSKETAKNPAKLIGTRTHLIMGILDRLSALRKNTAMEIMLENDIANNINLVEEIEKNQAIIIRIPESKFKTPEERDVVVTYWLGKIWMAAQIRSSQIEDRYKRKTVTVFLDELAQLESSERFVGSKLNQTAKFAVKFIISTMYINELKIRDVLRTSNTSYIMIAGAEKSNYKDLKEELEPFGFNLEDLQNLKPYHSLNYMKCNEGFSAFITSLPIPIVKE